MLYGAYHFLRPGDMRAQAEHFLETVDDAAGILLALDHEDPKVPLSDAKDWLQHVHDAVGRWPVLYSGFLIKQQLGHAIDPLLKQCRLWLAQYAAVPIAPANWGDPWLWQYTGDGSGPQPHNVPGITIAGNGIDINHYGFSDDQLREEWAS
jgi:lysozyme